MPTIEEVEEPKDDETFEQVSRLDKFYAPNLINKYFFEYYLIRIIGKLKDYKKNPKTLQMHNGLIIHLTIGLKRLENDIKNMSQNEIENKRLNCLKDLVRKILDANQKLDDMPPLETEEEAAQRQKGQGLEIMTPKQMITRLPILLAQLKAGNNSQTLKNEIRQLLYSLYRSKNLSKTIYNSLMNTLSKWK